MTYAQSTPVADHDLTNSPVKLCAICGPMRGPLSLDVFARDRGKKDGRRSYCKDCGNAQTRTYYQRHAQEQRQSKRAYREAHPEAVTQTLQRYYWANSEQRRADARAYYHTHTEAYAARHKKRYAQESERLRACSRAYWAVHKEQVKARNKTWRASHPVHVRGYARKRRQRLYRTAGSHTETEWQGLCAAYSQRCLRCGRADVRLTRDHIIPLVRGGSDFIANIQPLCGPCNSTKHTNTTDYRK